MATALPISDARLRADAERRERLTGVPPWVSHLRERAFGRFRELGFPGPRDEQWHYTNLRELAAAEFDVEGGLVPDAAPEELAGFDGYRLCFVNGRFAPSLSSVHDLPEGVVLGGLAALLADPPPGIDLSERLGHVASWESLPFAALNTAWFEDGAVLAVPRGCVLPRPVHLQFLTSPGGRRIEQHPRLLILAGESSETHVIETWSALEDSASFTNVVTEVALGPNALLEHVKLQQDSFGGTHVATVAVRQDRDSRFRSRLLSLGGGLVRNGLRVELAGEGADCELDGLYVGSGRQHVDNHVFVRHAVPRATSRQLYKSVLTDRATGAFTGKVLVDPHAQVTEAHQSNRNLLLSPTAVADTRPQLEIFADDVRCTHGATIGRLDDDALFYLRSRGIGRAEAQSLLTQAFALEVLERVQVPSLAAELCAPVHARLEALTLSPDGP